MDYKSGWRRRTRQWAINLLGGKCVVCGSTEALEYDHIDASSKSFDVSVGIRDGYSLARISEELEKCQLLCKRHNAQKCVLLKEHTGGSNKVICPAHGTAVMYGREKCRCAVCKAWKVAYRGGVVDARGRSVLQE